MTKRLTFILPAMMAASLFGAGCAAPPAPEPVTPAHPEQAATSPAPVVGGDRDEHGCIGSAGYRWCEPKKQCLRFWETPCYPSAVEAIRSALAEALGVAPAEIFVNISASTTEYAKGTVGKVGEENGPAGMFLASQGNNIWIIDYHGNGQADCAALKERGYPASMLKNMCD